MAPANETIVEVTDLAIAYKTDRGIARAVNCVSFSIAKGETLGLVGETGAGKTTTAFGIMRLLPKNSGLITNGSIMFGSHDIVHMSEQDMMHIRGEKISMIFQDPMTSLNPVVPVGLQIAEVLELHKKMNTVERSNRVDEMLSLVGIQPERKTEYPYQFSGGMKQRVVIAMALACDPELLIADEPTTALDVTIQAQVIDMMEQLKKRLGTSIIMITHDLGIVAQTCDRVALMYAGEIIESGTALEIYSTADHHPYTQGLFGSIPDMTKKTRRLNPITGMAPDPMNLPEGCKFSPRCPYCKEICKDEPPMVSSSGSHMVRCHLFKSGR